MSDAQILPAINSEDFDTEAVELDRNGLTVTAYLEATRPDVEVEAEIEERPRRRRTPRLFEQLRRMTR